MLSPEEKFGFEKGENINCVSYCKVKGEPCRVPEREAASVLALWAAEWLVATQRVVDWL